MKTLHDLSTLEWKLAGFTPFAWHGGEFSTIDSPPDTAIHAPDVLAIPAHVPGSVQAALLEAGIVPDWNDGLDSRQCEWVENRHWVYETNLPDDWLERGLSFRLRCDGLDYSGWIALDGSVIAEFCGTNIPHTFDLTEHLAPTKHPASMANRLQIAFDCPPRWLGQLGHTSRVKEWKTRFNYTWDWVPRLVQIGIWDSISLVATDGDEIERFRCTADADLATGRGKLALRGAIAGDKAATVRVGLSQSGASEDITATADFDVSDFGRGIVWSDLPVDLWWPNLEGEQPLYDLCLQLLDGDGNELDGVTRRVGFKNVVWEQCEGAPEGADPWICVVNGRPVFLQGVNFAPIRPNFADLTYDDYAVRLKLYRDLGCNTMRINACGFLEHKWFYDLCDELGIMVWQEFPLTSSGIENWPPDDETSIAGMAEIAESFIERRQHHASLLLWSGGNELMDDLEGRETDASKPCDLSHPMLKRLQLVVAELDPTRRYIPASPTGPLAHALESDFGKGLHWNVHGPYMSPDSAEEERDYWAGDDALFRAEFCRAGANPVEIIRRYKGEYPEFPPTADNDYWGHPTRWWVDWHLLVELHGREPTDLEEYVGWSQERQAKALALGVKTCKERFPRCGGVLLWGSHDTSSIPINTTIIDFHGNPKPAALALEEIWRGNATSHEQQ